MKDIELVLANCIDEVRSGRSTIEDCLQRYSALRAELKPLLETALQIKPDITALSGQSRSRVRSRLLAAMHDQDEAGQEQRSRPWLRPVFTFRMATVVVGVLLAIALAGGGTVYASQRSLPGDPLYPIKTSSENLQAALTFDREGKANLRLRLAGRRVAEVASQTNLGVDPGTSAAARVAEQLDKAVRGIDSSGKGEVKEFMGRLAESSLHGQLTLDSLAASSSSSHKQSLQKVIDVLRRGKLIADVSYENPDFLDSRPSVTDEDLEEGQFKIAGTLTSTDGGTWKIDGLTLNSVRYSGELPPVNSRVRTEGLTRAGKIFVTKIERDEDNTDEVRIQGTFKGTSEGGSIWNVGGIPVSVPQGSNVPSEGDELHLRRPPDGDNTSFSQVEANEPKRARVEFDGKLTSVDVNTKTITVSRSGTRIQVNITGALLRTEDKRPMTIAQLQSSVSREIEVKGLFRKDGVLYAAEVRVEGGETSEDR